MMMEPSDVYTFVVAMMPLYFALILGFCSVKWWKIFTSEQECDGFNKLVCYFALPFFTFHFISQIDPFNLNLPFLAADSISKIFIFLALAVWAYFCPRGTYGWFITSFSLSSLTNSLVVGVPIVKVMFGPTAVDLVIQGSVIQAIVWLTVLLCELELWKMQSDFSRAVDVSTVDGGNGEGERKDLEEATMEEKGRNNKHRHFLKELMKNVLRKLARNPNFYSCIIGFAWALVAKRFGIKMPSIVEESVEIMSTLGIGITMFNMGIFMALQENLIGCGSIQAIMGMVLKFIVGPAAMAIASVAMGLNGNVLRVAIIQAAIPQSVTSFVYAKEYKLHPEVLSTAVIFGAIASLPVSIAYYVALRFVS